MSTTSIQALHHPFHHHHHSSCFPSSLDNNNNNNNIHVRLSVLPHKPLSLILPTSSTLTPIASQTSSSFDILAHHLSTSNFRNADDETRRLLILLAGEQSQQRGYVFFSEVQFISPSDLATIDQLWRHHSGGKFGYSVQRRIWDKSLRDFTRLFIKLGWMKKLDTEVEQHNYRAFPDEFMWELNDETPEGHLPLTNALRGTQLMANILTHPAFEVSEEESSGEEEKKMKMKPSSVGFKSDYSF